MNQAVETFVFNGFAELVAVNGNQARAFDGHVVDAVFAAALIGGEVHIDWFAACLADFHADDDFFAATVDDRIAFDIDSGIFKFQHGAGVGAD